LDALRATELCAAAFLELDFELDRLGELSIALVAPDEIESLNRRHRGIDAPTDVLSFELDGPYGEMVGEVVISPPCAHPEMGVDELVVHGALHLAGMDHGDEFEASEMSGVQRRIMERLGG
jgi:probable rRNA maturation factor